MEEQCRSCGEMKGNGPDPCLGYLPGIAHACCGHGHIPNAYCVGWPGCVPDELIRSDGIKFNPNKGTHDITSSRPGFWIKRGKEALEYMFSLKKT